MHNNIGTNLEFTSNQQEVDQLNSEFYNKIKYPWPPAAFEKLTRADFWRKMISQDLGYWEESIIPKAANIWVAGCGTNQAIFTALRFPDAHVIGSDLSKESLLICEKNAKQLKISNLQLRNESINDSKYNESFDYLICTGVIHHNSDPKISLLKLAQSLKPSGIMEIMVYNKFHRINTAAFQVAVRILAGNSVSPNLEEEFSIARKIADNFPKKCSMLNLLMESKESDYAAFADALLQPVEHSYTIETLAELSNDCGLEILHFCIDQFSKDKQALDWNLEFGNRDVDKIYNNLSDIKRWQVSNLLLGEASPMLWFYIQRKGSNYPRKTQQQICNEFLKTKFKRIDLEKELYIIDDNGSYNEDTVKIPVKLNRNIPFVEAKKVYDSLETNKPIEETIKKIGMDTSFLSINKLRTYLSTSAFPYLESWNN